MITLILIIIVVAFALFLMNRFLPIDANIKSLITYIAYFVIVMLVILFVLRLFGLYDGPNLNLK